MVSCEGVFLDLTCLDLFCLDLTHFEEERQESHRQLDGDAHTRHCRRQARRSHHVLLTLTLTIEWVC